MYRIVPALSKRLLLAAALAVTGIPAMAQETASTTATPEPLQEVIVTGSRIAQPNLTSTSPIQVVTSQEIKLQGATDMTDLINRLPQNFQNSVTDFGNSTNPLTEPGGISTVDLRGLGPQRTLVLVDGRRLGLGDPNTGNPNPAPDINQIPPLLVERIDVVTGGASAVYGSDAIAGVVNFIMKKDYQGIQIDGQYGIDQHSNHDGFMQGLISQGGFAEPASSIWDGHNRSLSLVMGSNSPDDKGNVTGYFTYHSQDPVSQGNRDFSACKLNVDPSPTNPNIINVPSCNGSENSNLFAPTYNPSASAVYSVVGNQLLPYPQAGSSPPALFNSNPYQILSRPDTRYMGGFFSHYDINEYVQPYLDFSFMNDQASTEVAPSALFLGGNPTAPQGQVQTGGLFVNCTPRNPLLSAQEFATLCNPANNVTNGLVDVQMGRRNIEGGPRSSDYEHNNYRAVYGFKGAAFDAWTYDVYGSYYYTSLYQANFGYESYARAQNALLVTTGPLGTPVCAGGQAGCVPYNIWTQGAVTPAQTNYLNTIGTSQGTVTERIISGNTTGDLGKYGIKSPWATDGIAVNLGTEHRNDQEVYTPDAEEEANDLAGFGGAAVPVNGGFDVQEEFIELRAPLAQQQPWAEQLTAGAAYRHSKYSTAAGNVNTYKFDIQYAPIKDVLVRASFDRAIRAPNIIELFTPQSVTNTSIVASDPCAGANPTASLANCMHTGVTAAQYGHILQCPAGQCATLQGGNPDLAPETANTLSFGATFQPTFFTGFTASIDYYKIQLKQEITNVPIDIALNQCLATADPTFCSSVVRTPIGTLFGTTINGGGYIKGTNVNIASAQVSGVDIQMAYHLGLGNWGTLSSNFTGTYLDTQNTQPLPISAQYNCAGLYGPTCQTVNPRWRHTMRVTWQTPADVLVSANWRFIGSVKLDNNTGSPELVSSAPGYGPGVYDQFDARLPNMSYIDLIVSWDVMKNLNLRAGCNNLFDKDPPLVSSLLAGTGSPNTYPTYDLLGRELFAAFTAKF